MPLTVLTDLDMYKLPALKQAGFTIVDRPKVLLMSKSGYAPALERLAASDDRLVLIDVDAELDI